MLPHTLWTQCVRYALSRDVGVNFVMLFLNFTHIFSFLSVVTAETRGNSRIDGVS